MLEVPDIKDKTLREVVDTWIDKRSTVYTDEWRAYNFALEEYDHYKVCHKKNFVDPNTSVHTQQIEAFWSVYKRWMRRRGYNLGPLKNLATYMGEFLWWRKNKTFEDFLKCLSNFWTNQ